MYRPDLLSSEGSDEGVGPRGTETDHQEYTESDRNPPHVEPRATAHVTSEEESWRPAREEGDPHREHCETDNSVVQCDVLVDRVGDVPLLGPEVEVAGCVAHYSYYKTQAAYSSVNTVKYTVKLQHWGFRYVLQDHLSYNLIRWGRLDGED